MTQELPPDADERVERPVAAWILTRALYPNSYLWFVFVSALDIMLTWKILLEGGTETNPIAAAVIKGWGLVGAILFKFGVTIFVIFICEFVGRERSRLGQSLAILAVAMSAIPVVYSLYLLILHRWIPIEVVA